MIDFHCHLDLYPKPSDVLARLRHYRCFVLAVTTTPLAWNGTSRLVSGIGGVHMAAGLHPELVVSRHQEVDRLCELISITKYVGEIGLDGSPRHKISLPVQVLAFERVIDECERLGGRILSIHSRGAARPVLDILKKKVRNSTPVLHWFSGSASEVVAAVEMGCWFSVGPAMLRTKKGQILASLMPKDRVLTETDGPFTVDSSAGHLMPWHALIAERSLASIWGIGREETHYRISQNLLTLVGPEDAIGSEPDPSGAGDFDGGDFGGEE